MKQLEPGFLSHSQSSSHLLRGLVQLHLWRQCICGVRPRLPLPSTSSATVCVGGMGSGLICTVIVSFGANQQSVEPFELAIQPEQLLEVPDGCRGVTAVEACGRCWRSDLLAVGFVAWSGLCRGRAVCMALKRSSAPVYGTGW